MLPRGHVGGVWAVYEPSMSCCTRGRPDGAPRAAPEVATTERDTRRAAMCDTGAAHGTRHAGRGSGPSHSPRGPSSAARRPARIVRGICAFHRRAAPGAPRLSQALRRSPPPPAAHWLPLPPLCRRSATQRARHRPSPSFRGCDWSSYTEIPASAGAAGEGEAWRPGGDGGAAAPSGAEPSR